MVAGCHSECAAPDPAVQTMLRLRVARLAVGLHGHCFVVQFDASLSLADSCSVHYKPKSAHSTVTNHDVLGFVVAEL